MENQMDRMGFEPMASCLQSRRSSTDLPAQPNFIFKVEPSNQAYFDQRMFLMFNSPANFYS
jgi:hypothetical protein